MPRYSLRTLLILLAIGPPLLAAAAFVAFSYYMFFYVEFKDHPNWTWPPR